MGLDKRALHKIKKTICKITEICLKSSEIIFFNSKFIKITFTMKIIY